MPKYTIGIDFGTLSGRAVLISVSDGSEIAQSVYEYPHQVMDKALPSGISIPPEWALSHPQDYIDVLYHVIPEVIRTSEVDPEDIIGIGIDATSCSILPVKKDGTPLCFLPEFTDEPHAYIKLWKHHGTQKEADFILETAEKMHEPWLGNYGGKVSSESLLPKILQLLKEAPYIYDAADDIIELGDWIVWMLTGNKTHSACCSGYKAFWNKQKGFPDTAFYRALDERLENFVSDKFSGPILPFGSKAGGLTEDMAHKLGLKPGIAVSSSTIDAHSAVPAVINREGQCVAVIGTSTCQLVLSKEEHYVPGIFGCVEDGMIPGFFGYEAGQSCTGDSLAWYTENLVPYEYVIEAKERGIDIHSYLTGLAEKQKPGESGLIVLDWFGGNRSILSDASLSALILGMTITTKPEDIYRAIIEATAFGTRVILDNYREHGVEVNEFYAVGGIVRKNPMMMQIYADVLKMPVCIAASSQCSALGSAIAAAVAAGKDAGGYGDVFTANSYMAHILPDKYEPIQENSAVYDKLYDEYKTLHDHFALGENDVMKRIRGIKYSQLK